MNKFKEMTQAYSTFGDKLLQHTDVLYSIQNDKKFKPITVQLAPTNVCDLSCDYCSVKGRNKKSEMTIEEIFQGLKDFKEMGAKAVEITGGGNPLLYPYINEVIEYCSLLRLEVGIITNSINPRKYLTINSICKISWIRVSLSALDFNKEFDLTGIHEKKLGLSYIINDKTTKETIKKISDIADYYNVKFVRLAPDCLNDDALTINSKWDELIKKQSNKKMFIKEINDNYFPFSKCYVGLIRPYWTPEGVFICSSHVLEAQRVLREFKMCDISMISKFWNDANEKYKDGEMPYCLDTKQCYHCYYYNNNKILHTVATEMPDRNFA